MSQPDVSDKELKLRKLDRRDKSFRAFELFILFALILFNAFIAYKLLDSIKQNENSAKQARITITNQQGETQKYIKCILLLRYDYPPEEITTKAQAETALDTCAKNENQ